MQSVLSFTSYAAFFLFVPVLLLIIVRTCRVLSGCIGCLIACLIGSLIPGSILSVTVLSVAVLVTVFVTVSAIRRVVLCICVSCHCSSIPAPSRASLESVCLLQRYYLKFETKIYSSLSINYLQNGPLFSIAFYKWIRYTMSVTSVSYDMYVILYPLLIIYTPLRKSQAPRI